MIQIPAALAPAFSAAFVLTIFTLAVAIIVRGFRNRQTEPNLSLAQWREDFTVRLQMDGRWTSMGNALWRKIECGLYAPDRSSGTGGSMPRVARLSHTVRSIGPWVLRGTTQLETHHQVVQLDAERYFELLPQFGLTPRSWAVSIDGVRIGTLSRTAKQIVGRNAAGNVVCTWHTPSVPGRLRTPTPSEAEALTPWYTPLEILGATLQMRLPFFDGRQHPYDFGAVPFIQGTIAHSRIHDWALAFVALSGHTALALRIATPRRPMLAVKAAKDPTPAVR